MKPGQRLCEDAVLAQQQAARWWSHLDQQAASGGFLAGATLVLVTAAKPGPRATAPEREPR